MELSCRREYSGQRRFLRGIADRNRRVREEDSIADLAETQAHLLEYHLPDMIGANNHVAFEPSERPK